MCLKENKDYNYYYNLLLVAIPEDTRKSEPINPKNKLKTLL